MPSKQASRSCARCQKMYESPTGAESTDMISIWSERLCPKCKQQHLAEIVNGALRGNVEKLYMLADQRNG